MPTLAPGAPVSSKVQKARAYQKPKSYSRLQRFVESEFKPDEVSDVMDEVTQSHRVDGQESEQQLLQQSAKKDAEDFQQKINQLKAQGFDFETRSLSQTNAGPSEVEPRGQQSVTAGADSRYIWQNSKPYALRVYNRELQVIPNVPPREGQKPPRRRKGDITTFSRSSRLRLMRKMNRVHAPILGTPIFITLTHRHGSHTNEEFQHVFKKKFLPGLKEIIPQSCHIWRLEPHRSGKPHYHMIVWSFRKRLKLHSPYYGRKIRKHWRDCIDQHDKAAQLYSCRIEKLGSHKKAMMYVSKYVAKEDDDISQEIEGRRWACSTNLPTAAITEVFLTQDQYDNLKQIVEVILKSKNKPQGLIDRIIGSNKMMWTWLDPNDIEAVLDYIGLSPPINQYKTFRKTGSSHNPIEEMAELAHKYGHSY